MVAIDASYEWGFGIVVYQVPKYLMEKLGLSIDDIQTGRYDRRLERVVRWDSREITSAEQRYWPTELETGGLVFAVRKTRHIMETSRFPTIVFTDHVAVMHIAHSTTLKSTSPDRSNLRLIRAAQHRCAISTR